MSGLWHVPPVVVIADTLFTATAVVLQPLTGVGLAGLSGQSLSNGWIGLSLGLCVLTGVFWLQVVWIQLRLRDLARAGCGRGAMQRQELRSERCRRWRHR